MTRIDANAIRVDSRRFAVPQGRTMTDCQSLDATPLHAKHYADGAAFVSAPIIENVQLARDTFRLRFEAPAIAAAITPGQFVMVRIAGIDDPLLGRAFALYDTSEDGTTDERTRVDVVYLVHGKLTSLLATRKPGDRVEVWGPLGNGFVGSGETLDHLILVAGGIGYTPFLATGKEALAQKTYGASSRSRLSAKRVTFCYGVRTAAYLAGEQDFRAAGFDLRVASNDGSVGHNGLVTDLLQQALEETAGQSRRVLCCGPEPMMHAVADICLAADVRCDVSLETPMACGLGVCFSCVAKVRQPDGEWDYKRTCVEGPIFDASLIEW
jgi:dihydroorotate dehydrogenase electron transfer subunit